MKNPRFTLLAGIVCAAALSRLIPHPWNFSPVAAIALFGGAHFSKKGAAFLVPLAALLISDIVIGFYPGMWTVYGSFALIVLIGRWLKNHSSIWNTGGAAVMSSLLFFTVSNFGAWMYLPEYPKTLAGLQLCFAAAIPFYQTTLLGDLFYTAILFGAFALAERRVPALRESFAS